MLLIHKDIILCPMPDKRHDAGVERGW